METAVSMNGAGSMVLIGGIAWNDPDIGIEWHGLEESIYNKPELAVSDGYFMEDGTPLTVSEKDQKWGGIKGYKK